MSLVVVELLAPPHLTNSFSDLADFLHYQVRHHFLNLLGYSQPLQFHLVHLLVRPPHQAAILPQIVIAALFALVNHQVVVAIVLFAPVDHQIVATPILFTLTVPLMALNPLAPRLL